uniref:Uncharacterized protein n=1 Tax=Rhizophora mucronata TaxID=61149 RepID=A0A2P2IS29_RHIMU
MLHQMLKNAHDIGRIKRKNSIVTTINTTQINAVHVQASSKLIIHSWTVI